ncbi:MAG TPA: Rid family hydrolase [Steroidobacteraceae bacterium]|jgi:2-iminobutanoate/2-iminopropanoate deaminase
MNIVIRVIITAAGLMAPLALGAADTQSRYIVADHSAARAALPFSDAVVAGGALYVSGTLGLDPKSMSDPKTARVPEDPAAEAKLAMEAVKRTVEAAGYQMDDFVSIQVFCTDLGLYGAFNDIYRTYFNGHFPARAFIGVDKLVRGARFEVMGTAVKGPH